MTEPAMNGLFDPAPNRDVRAMDGFLYSGHHLGRFTRRTKVVSRKESMVELTLRIWHAVTTTNQFSSLQQALLSIFK
jgi:hypothetical protein